MSDDYTIERISPERLKDLVFLHLNCFGKKISLRYYQKKFSTEAFGASYIGYMAYAADGTPAGYYGLYPCQLRYNSKLVTAASSGDTMTHTDHRGKGLFVNLARKTFALARDSGVVFAYGFPNQNSYAGSLKTGWTYKGDKIHLYTFPVSTLPLAALARKLSLVNAAYSIYLQCLFRFYGGEKEVFQNSGITENTGGVEHNTHFRAYKNYTRNHVLKTGPGHAWIRIDSELKVGDVERLEKEQLPAMLKKLKRLAFQAGCTELQWVASAGSHTDRILHLHYTPMETFPIARMNLGADFPVEQTHFTLADFDTF